MGEHLSTISLGQNDFSIRVLLEDFLEEGGAWVVHGALVP
jgi:hypothetical protein